MKSWRTEMTIWTDLAGIGFRLDYVDAGGTRTRALIAGEGQDIIALHGTSGHLEAFSRNIVPHVRAGFRIPAIDALGHGYKIGSASCWESGGQHGENSVVPGPLQKNKKNT